MGALLGTPRRGGLLVLCSLVIAGGIFIFESRIGRIGGTVTLLALLASLFVTLGCGYMNGGYPATLLCGYLPFAGSGFANAMEFRSIEFLSSEIYHVLWSLGVAGVITGTVGFVGGIIVADRMGIRENRRQILLAVLAGIVLSGFLWSTCSPFSSAPCGAVGGSL